MILIERDVNYNWTRTACYTRLEGEEGLLESPGYPADYPSNQDCYYDIVRTSSSVCGIRLYSTLMVTDAFLCFLLICVCIIIFTYHHHQSKIWTYRAASPRVVMSVWTITLRWSLACRKEEPDSAAMTLAFLVRKTKQKTNNNQWEHTSWNQWLNYTHSLSNRSLQFPTGSDSHPTLVSLGFVG